MAAALAWAAALALARGSWSGSLWAPGTGLAGLESGPVGNSLSVPA